MDNQIGINSNALIKTEAGNISVAVLFEQFINNTSLPLIKTFDEPSKCFVFRKCESISKSLVSSGCSLVTNNKRRLDIGANTLVLTKEGFKQSRDLQLSDKLATNGVPSHQNKDWLEDAKRESILNSGGLSFIAKKAGVSYHTIRKWLRIFGIQFTKLEVASYSPVWNKGLPTDIQPMYGKTHSDDTRCKMRESSRIGDKSLLWKGGVDRGFRQEVFDWQYKYQNRLLKDYWNSCALCKSEIDLEIDHIKPVKSYPELAFDYDNLQILCSTCHSNKSAKEYSESPNYSKLTATFPIRDLLTYNLRLANATNFVANGLIILSN